MHRTSINWEKLVIGSDDKTLEYRNKRSNVKLVIKATQAGELISISYHSDVQEFLDNCQRIRGCSLGYATNDNIANDQFPSSYIQIDETNDPSLIKFVMGIINNATPLAERENEIYSILKINHHKNIVSVMDSKLRTSTIDQSTTQLPPNHVSEPSTETKLVYAASNYRVFAAASHSTKDDLPFKIFFVGDPGVGISTILNHSGEPEDKRYYSIYTNKVTSNNQEVSLQIFKYSKTEEQCRRLNQFPGTRVYAMVFDITDKVSFKNIFLSSFGYRQEIERQDENYTNKPIILVGNKCDLRKERVVSYEEAAELAKNMGCEYFEVSGLSGENVPALFNHIAKSCLSMLPPKIKQEPVNLSLSSTVESKSSSGCTIS